MKDTLTGALRDCAERLLEDQHLVSPEEIVECARARHPGVFAIETERLVLIAARRTAKELLRDQAADDDGPQPCLPGLRLPSAIAIPVGDDYAYVRSDKASLQELEAGEIIRVRNVDSAVAALDRYRESVERLRPHFDADHLTVLKAWEAWRQAEEATA